MARLACVPSELGSAARLSEGNHHTAEASTRRGPEFWRDAAYSSQHGCFGLMWPHLVLGPSGIVRQAAEADRGSICSFVAFAKASPTSFRPHGSCTSMPAFL